MVEAIGKDTLCSSSRKEEAAWATPGNPSTYRVSGKEETMRKYKEDRAGREKSRKSCVIKEVGYGAITKEYGQQYHVLRRGQEEIEIKKWPERLLQ